MAPLMARSSRFAKSHGGHRTTVTLRHREELRVGIKENKRANSVIMTNLNQTGFCHTLDSIRLREAYGQPVKLVNDEASVWEPKHLILVKHFGWRSYSLLSCWNGRKSVGSASCAEKISSTRSYVALRSKASKWPPWKLVLTAGVTLMVACWARYFWSKWLSPHHAISALSSFCCGSSCLGMWFSANGHCFTAQAVGVWFRENLASAVVVSSLKLQQR